MNELSKYLVEQILLEDDNTIKNVIVVYSGRFQPFHKGHYKTYEGLVKKFGKNNVYIGTSNKVALPKSPFDFKEKKKVMQTMFGIPSSKIVQIKNPYAPTEILKKYDDQTTGYITVVGEKDANRLGGKYFTKYKGKIEEPYKERGYVYISPAQPNAVSGTDVRNGLGNGTESDKKDFFTKRAYPKFNKSIFDLITKKLNETFVIERETIEEWLMNNNILNESSANNDSFGSADDGPTFMFPNYDIYDKISQKRARKIGYEVVDMIMNRELEDYYEHPTYPNGPANAVSYYPAGVMGAQTPNNQIDIYSNGAYSKWYKHMTRKATLCGYQLVFTQIERDASKKLSKLAGDDARGDKDSIQKKPSNLKEEITLPIEIGDTLLMGKFKNKKVVVKTIGKDDHGVPTINGKKVFTFRYGSKRPNIFDNIVEFEEDMDESATKITEAVVDTFQNLGILRKDMPQIQSGDMNNYLKYLTKNNISYQKGKYPIYKLKLTQKDINLDKVEKLSTTNKSNLSKPIVISKDSYILDGHHRVLALYSMNEKETIPTIKVNLPIKELLKTTHRFDDVSYKSVNESVTSFEYSSDLLDVGKKKAVGYLPLGTIKRYGGKPNDLISWAQKNKLKYKKFTSGATFGGALYIWDENSLKKILNKYKKSLEAAGVPTTPDEYIRYIEHHTVHNDKYPDAYKVIGLTFNDKRWRVNEVLEINEANDKLKLKIPSDIKKIHSAFKKNGKKLYVVGGAVRDAILGKSPKDFDLATDAKPDETLEIAKKAGFNTAEVGKAFGVVIVGGHEIATFRKDIGKGRRPDTVDYTDIAGDVKRRDLTINALFYDMDKNSIVDLVGGIEDLKKNKIRTVGKAAERFEEDPLRKLRALRFQTRLGGKMDKDVMSALKQDPTLNGVSSERIRDEFLKSIKSSKYTSKYMETLDKIGFTKLILPNLKVSKPYINSNDPIIFLSYLLRDNDPSKLGKTLNKLNYTTDETKNIVFLNSLQNFKPENVYSFKKSQERTSLTDNQITEFGKLIGKDMKKFLKFNLSVKGNEVPTDIKGPEIGKWIQNKETEKFLNEITKKELDKVEDYADKVLSPVDVDFTNHFFDRLNDPRNGKEISSAELTGFFKRLSRYKKQWIDFLKKYNEIVVNYKRNDINIPFVSKVNKVIGKTVMRKSDFKTHTPKFTFEHLDDKTINESLELSKSEYINQLKKLKTLLSTETENSNDVSLTIDRAKLLYTNAIKYGIEKEYISKDILTRLYKHNGESFKPYSGKLYSDINTGIGIILNESNDFNSKKTMVNEEKIKYYEKYFRNLTPKSFDINTNGNKIEIQINETIKPTVSVEKKPKPINNKLKKLSEVRKNDSIENITQDMDLYLENILTENLDVKLSKKYGIKLDIYEYDDYLELNRIVVPDDKRNMGIGSKVMNDIIEYSKKHNKDIFLTPSTDFGGTKSRLIKFYKSFGFKLNKGSNRDFRSKESMVLTT